MSSITSDVQPIKPNELPKHKATKIPDRMVAIINELLVENYRHGRKTIKISQNEIKERWNDDDTWDILYLDFEHIFEQAGYTVVYNKPSYGDCYPACFTFTWE
jgi:hypothetical protein